MNPRFLGEFNGDPVKVESSDGVSLKKKIRNPSETSNKLGDPISV